MPPFGPTSRKDLVRCLLKMEISRKEWERIDGTPIDGQHE